MSLVPATIIFKACAFVTEAKFHIVFANSSVPGIMEKLAVRENYMKFCFCDESARSEALNRV